MVRDNTPRRRPPFELLFLDNTQQRENSVVDKKPQPTWHCSCIGCLHGREERFTIGVTCGYLAPPEQPGASSLPWASRGAKGPRRI